MYAVIPIIADKNIGLPLAGLTNLCLIKENLPTKSTNLFFRTLRLETIRTRGRMPERSEDIVIKFIGISILDIRDQTANRF